MLVGGSKVKRLRDAKDLRRILQLKRAGKHMGMEDIFM